MKTHLIIGVGFLVALAAGVGVAWLHRQSMSEMSTRLDALSHEVSALRSELVAEKSGEISPAQRDAILKVIADDRDDQERQQDQAQKQQYLEVSLSRAQGAALKFGLTDDQRSAFAEVLRLGRDKLKAADAQLTTLYVTSDYDTITRATEDTLQSLTAWRLEELTKRLGVDIAYRINEDQDFSVIADWSRLEAIKARR